MEATYLLKRKIFGLLIKIEEDKEILGSQSFPKPALTNKNKLESVFP